MGEDADLRTDPLLERAPVHEGYKVLGGVVLYQKLGQGGMGAVYRGKHLRLNVDVAVKVMTPPHGLPREQAESFVRRFIREAQSAAAVGHQNLIRVYDVDTESGIHFLIMDYVDGESAADRIKRKGRLPEVEAVEIALRAAEGLGAAHKRGIVHRDVKPDNVMIDKEGNVRVADLGLAKAYSGEAETGEPSMLTQTQAAMGTPYYMPPEQFVSARDVGPPADVWSLGVTLYQLLTGELPWADTSVFTLAKKIEKNQLPDPKNVCPELSGRVCSIIRKAVQKEPSKRYGTCTGLASALRKHLDSIGATEKSTLPDSDAGKTKLALVSMTAPPSRTLTLISAAALGVPQAERAGAPGRSAATTVAGEVRLGDVVERRFEVEELRKRVGRSKNRDETDALRAADREMRVAKEVAEKDPADALARLERAAEALLGIEETRREREEARRAEQERARREREEARRKRQEGGDEANKKTELILTVNLIDTHTHKVSGAHTLRFVERMVPVMQAAVGSPVFDQSYKANHNLENVKAWDAEWKKTFKRNDRVVSHAYYDVSLVGWHNLASLRMLKDAAVKAPKDSVKRNQYLSRTYHIHEINDDLYD